MRQVKSIRNDTQNIRMLTFAQMPKGPKPRAVV